MNGTKRQIFPSVIGNEQLKSTLSKDLADGKSAHAYIIEGPAGSGKHTVARNICAAVLCENRHDPSHPLPCGKCNSCKKIFSDISVDVLKITNGDRATIGVDSVRLIKESLYIPPNDGDKKFYIIENAETMTAQAQNALLLSLEEPPPHVIFLLLCTSDEVLLETIKSRAPTLSMEKFSPDTVEKYLREKYESKKYSSDDIIYASRLSRGSIGRAEDILCDGEGEIKKYKLAASLVKHLVSGKKSDALVFLSFEMPKDRQGIKEILSLSKTALRDIIADKKSAPLMFYSSSFGDHETAIPKEAKNMSQKKLVNMIDTLSEAEERLGANSSQTTTLLSLIFNA